MIFILKFPSVFAVKAAEKHLMTADRLYLSISWWEIAIKINIGKSSYDYAELLTIAKRINLDFLAITPQHGQTLLTSRLRRKNTFIGQYLLALIENILDFSKIESGKLELECVNFSLDTVIDTLTTLSTDHASAHGLRLQIEIADVSFINYAGWVTTHLPSKNN